MGVVVRVGSRTGHCEGEPGMNDPATWLTSHRSLLPATGDSLDLACGSGRHAIWLAEQGFRTLAVDRDAVAIGGLSQEAARRGLSIETRVVDLESGETFLGPDSFDLIVVVHYLHRPLIPALVRAIRPGGTLVYETFTRAQAARGKPTNPAFLLEPGELPMLVQPLEVAASREGDFEGRSVASVVAIRPYLAEALY
jgi:SAM-dependent methyltransferase